MLKTSSSCCCTVGVGIVNIPLDTIYVTSQTVFTANHLTDSDKQNSKEKIHQLNTSKKTNKIQQNKTILVHSLLTTLGQETRWAKMQQALLHHLWA